MTNKEWIESQNLPFAEGLKLWDKDRYPDFSDWLKASRRKYKVGDVIVGQRTGNKFVVIGVDVKDTARNLIFPYNVIEIQPNGRIAFTSNEDVKAGKWPKSWASDQFEDNSRFTKIA